MSNRRQPQPSQIGNWLALLLVGGFGGFIALAMIAPGIVLLDVEPADQAPREMDYASFARSRPYEDWYRLTDCMLSVPAALSMNDPSSPDELFIPVLDPESDSEEVHLLVRTRHPAYVVFIREMDAFQGTDEELDTWLLEREGLAYPVVTIEGTLNELAPELDGLRAALPQAAYDLAILDEGGVPPPPSSKTAVVLIIVGVVVGLVTIGGLVLLRRWQLRPRPTGPEDIADVFADRGSARPIEIDQAASLLASRAGGHARAGPYDEDEYLEDDLPVVYRRGHTVVVEDGAGETLPRRCVKCNAVANGPRLRRSLSWHHPGLYFVILAGLLFYVIVALIVRKTAVVWISLCDEHRKKRNTFIAVGWGGFCIAVLLIFVGAAQEMPLLAMAASLGMFACPIIGLLGARTIRALRIYDDEAHLAGFCDAFVAELPLASSVGRGRR